MSNKNILLISICLLILSACASTSPPQNPENLCEIYSEKPQWKKSALVSESKWRVPPHILMSILYQESSFKHDARPPRKYFLGIIPTGRVSSAYGYPQAKDEVWSDYQKENSRRFASRTNMHDALDFMGWYLDKAQKLNNVSKWDPYNLYLNYHEGWGGFARQSYQSKQWLKNTAAKVKNRAEAYGGQLAMCQ